MKRYLLGITLLGVALATPRASAQSPTESPPNAVELKKHGDDLVHDLHYREALAAYDAAYAMSHDPAILYNRGRAYDALGETPQALDELELFARTAPPDLRAKVPKLDELLAATRARVATVVIHCSVDGATLFVRSHREGTTPLAGPLRFRTGAALVEAQASGYKPFRTQLDLTAGAPLVIEIKLETDAAPLSPPHENRVVATGSSGWKWGAYSAGALGVVGVASGVTFGILAIARQISADAGCPEKACNPAGSHLIAEARTFATLSTVSLIVGGVGIAASALFFLWKPGASRTEARIIPMIGPLFGGIQGTF
ncbi:hypothetical protein BH09MYX1_BH09MYX1_51760 [soil metagenome]